MRALPVAMLVAAFAALVGPPALPRATPATITTITTIGAVAAGSHEAERPALPFADPGEGEGEGDSDSEDRDDDQDFAVAFDFALAAEGDGRLLRRAACGSTPPWSILPEPITPPPRA